MKDLSFSAKFAARFFSLRRPCLLFYMEGQLLFCGGYGGFFSNFLLYAGNSTCL